MAWDRLQFRLGDLPMGRIGGLAQKMPCFGLCLALLVMAGVGLPPFGLVFSFLGLLLSEPTLNTGTLIVMLTWFGISWYLFKLMQRLLFGPAREDLRYDDLTPVEIAAFVGVLLLLLLLSAAPEWSLNTVQEVARIGREIE